MSEPRRLIVELRLPEFGAGGLGEALQEFLEGLHADGAVERWTLTGVQATPVVPAPARVAAAAPGIRGSAGRMPNGPGRAAMGMR